MSDHQSIRSKNVLAKEDVRILPGGGGRQLSFMPVCPFCGRYNFFRRRIDPNLAVVLARIESCPHYRDNYSPRLIGGKWYCTFTFSNDDAWLSSGNVAFAPDFEYIESDGE